MGWMFGFVMDFGMHPPPPILRKILETGGLRGDFDFVPHSWPSRVGLRGACFVKLGSSGTGNSKGDRRPFEGADHDEPAIRFAQDDSVL